MPEITHKTITTANTSIFLFILFLFNDALYVIPVLQEATVVKCKSKGEKALTVLHEAADCRGET